MVEVLGSGKPWWRCLEKRGMLVAGQCSNGADEVHNLTPIILLSILVGEQLENVGGTTREEINETVGLVVMVG
jgi:hypothetical protein